MCDNSKLHVNNYYKCRLDPTKISPPPGFYPPALSPTPQTQNRRTRTPQFATERKAYILPHRQNKDPATVLNRQHCANLATSGKNIPQSTSESKARARRQRTRGGYAHAANKMLATIDFTDSDIRKWAVMDSGATGNFLVTDAPISERTEAHDQISVTLPDGSQVESTHTGLIDIPQLPKAARIGYVIPGLNTHSLMSVVVLCNAGCTVKFTKIGVTVKYRGSTILTGRKCTRTGLWMVPITETTTETANFLRASHLTSTD